MAALQQSLDESNKRKSRKRRYIRTDETLTVGEMRELLAEREGSSYGDGESALKKASDKSTIPQQISTCLQLLRSQITENLKPQQRLRASPSHKLRMRTRNPHSRRQKARVKNPEVEKNERSVSFIPDTIDVKSASPRLQTPDDSMSSNGTGTDLPEEGLDGPIFLALRLGNQNNNNNQAAQALSQDKPQDTLDVRFAVYELLEPSDHARDNRAEPPVFTQQRSDAEKIISDNHIPDTLNSKIAFMEVTGQEDNGNPPVLKMRGAVQTSRLTDDQVHFYNENGYLVVPNALSNQTVVELLQCVQESATALATGGPGVTKQVFSGMDKVDVNPNSRVIALLTNSAFEAGTTPLQNIQRLGCGIHRVLPPFRRAIMSAQHVEIARSLNYTDPCVVQSLVIVKAAQVGAKVVLEFFLILLWCWLSGRHTRKFGPNRLLQCFKFWHSLRILTTSSHDRCDQMTSYCYSKAAIICTGIFQCVPKRCTARSICEACTPVLMWYKMIEVKAGTLVLMHGNLMHTSAANKSRKSRVAFNFSVVEGGLGWLEDNYLQPYQGYTEFEKLHIC
ncbi:hypothetical protein OPT61_g7608 [Boeremia exigua]|uniref:Uncharacterized protein n=1 Tax=Boeremia exigua TaxID=749465 RepID=A0ACC2I1W5_9PLEO|nr:hypothetical protein OPT61_g7608 [Boeremia exigua]